MPRLFSARARILGAVLAVACVGLIVVGGVTFWAQRDHVVTAIDNQLQAFAAAFTNVSGVEAAEEIVVDTVGGPTEGALLLSGGTVVATASPASGLDLAADAAFMEQVIGAPEGLGTAVGDDGMYRYVVVSVGDAEIVNAVSLSARMELVHIGVGTYAIAAAGVLFAIGVVGWFVTGRLLLPIRRLRETADSITISDLGARITTDGTDEISDLGRTMNSMLDRLEGSVDVQRQLLDDVRHELKTPITIVRGHLEMMDASDPADVANAREIGISELDRMTRLVDDIDLLAAVEGGGFSMGVVDVDALTARVGELVAVIPGHPWSVEQRGRGRVEGDYDRLLQAWLQLADNASKYTPGGSPVEIGSSVDDRGALLWVRDHGPGIPPAARHRIFRRFDRALGKRTVGGSGLGLAIVDAIAKGHDGHCAVTETPGGGATFTIHLPLGRNTAPAGFPAPVRAGDVVLQREAAG
ncbi:signal transduction histidine kinase [Microbacterium sp. AG1240]|uniref:sensor histidine kinase n=1 Tax=Microbacterium sp. AG1240 TaxID=2183992 RepID=UPI000F167983|nr:HAMP domain-containing sensor histidine kinase [Microbacterium sp. AG1240]RKT36483.1 signal transduction histidine kinase [Microbacterium sp. AG1240]